MVFVIVVTSVLGWRPDPGDKRVQHDKHDTQGSYKSHTEYGLHSKTSSEKDREASTTTR